MLETLRLIMFVALLVRWPDKTVLKVACCGVGGWVAVGRLTGPAPERHLPLSGAGKIK